MTTKTARTARKPAANTPDAVAPTRAKAPLALATPKSTNRSSSKPTPVTAPRRHSPALPAPAFASSHAASKQARLIALLRSPKGGTIEQMTSLTGWQAHTVRGTISGVLRKRLSLNVVCSGEPGSRAYRIVAAVA